jgi:ParB-like chromosome segregation protein Spo0J
MMHLDDLHDHPRQRELFGELPASEFALLVADMRDNGQREPLRVLPSGRIVTGHQRVRAARALGWTTIAVIVLNILDEAEVEDLLIRDNLVRRHVGRLALARLYLAQRKSIGSEHSSGQGDLRRLPRTARTLLAL